MVERPENVMEAVARMKRLREAREQIVVKMRRGREALVRREEAMDALDFANPDVTGVFRSVEDFDREEAARSN
jgi:hypothetical protein